MMGVRTLASLGVAASVVLSGAVQAGEPKPPKRLASATAGGVAWSVTEWRQAWGEGDGSPHDQYPDGLEIHSGRLIPYGGVYFLFSKRSAGAREESVFAIARGELDVGYLETWRVKIKAVGTSPDEKLWILLAFQSKWSYGLYFFELPLAQIEALPRLPMEKLNAAERSEVWSRLDRLPLLEPDAEIFVPDRQPWGICMLGEFDIAALPDSVLFLSRSMRGCPVLRFEVERGSKHLRYLELGEEVLSFEPDASRADDPEFILGIAHRLATRESCRPTSFDVATAKGVSHFLGKADDPECPVLKLEIDPEAGTVHSLERIPPHKLYWKGPAEEWR